MLNRRQLLTGVVAALFIAGSLGIDRPDHARAADPKAPLIAIDPGHDAKDWGTSGVVAGKKLVEKDLTLTVARHLAENLKAAGYRTLLTRNDDTPPGGAADRTGEGKVDVADSLQARVDKANEAGATILVSIHFNGSTDRTLRGPEVYYSAQRPFAAQNRKLADAVMAGLIARMGAAGRPVTPRGVLRDAVLGGGALYLLGPAGGRIVRPSNMPGVLIEGLFLSNPDDAAVLADPVTLQTLARGYADGIAAYLGPPPKPTPKKAVVVSAGGAFLRPSPLLGTEPILTLPIGATVDVAEAARGDDVGGAADWWRVDYRGKPGYVFAPLLQPAGTTAAAAAIAAAPPPPLPKSAVVKNDDGRNARLRAKPPRDAEIVDRAAPGEALEILEQADGEAVDGTTTAWLKVKRGERVGWIWAPLVEA
jgi:N-acetylmuramoyl-L-alanine amidase